MLMSQPGTLLAVDKNRGLAAKKEPIVTTAPDYSTLRLKGNMQTQNSFALTVHAAAKLLGKEADYQDSYHPSASSQCCTGYRLAGSEYKGVG